MMLILLTGVILFGSSVASAQQVVDDDGMGTPTNCSATNPAFTSIQAAVNAAPVNATITVCPGTYDEQVVISKNGQKLTGKADGNNNLILIKKTGYVANTTSLAGAMGPIAAGLLVSGASNVIITNVTVDGAMNGIGNNCSPNVIGIYYRNSSGTVTNSVSRNMKLTGGGGGCQSGIGIFLQTGAGPGVPAAVNLTNNNVHDYQKNGITANEAGTVLTATNNTVVGGGVNPIIAQNGIQIAFGATGTLTNNNISDHVYGGCVSTVNCSAASTNVLVYQSDGVKLINNKTVTANVGIYYAGSSNGTIQGNASADARVFDGIAVFDDGGGTFSDNNLIQSNNVDDSDEAGIFVNGNANAIFKNTINEAPVGVEDDGTNNVGTGTNANLFYNTDQKVIDASPRGGFGGTAPAVSVNRP